MLTKWQSWVPFHLVSRWCHILNSGEEIFMTWRFTVLRGMLIVSSWVSYHGGKWKCWNVVLHAGGNGRMWMGTCVLMNLGASSGQMRVIPIDTAVGAQLAFLICREHLFSIPDLFLAYMAAIHDGGLTSGWRDALILQNCPLAFWHILNWCSKISTAFVSSYVMPKYLLFML